MKAVGRIVILVREYEEAIDFYSGRLGMEKFVDIDAGAQRYVHLRIPGQPEVGVWLLRAQTEMQRQRVGRQTEGQPCAVFYTDDLVGDYHRLSSAGVHFVREPATADGASFAHFNDLYGNEFVVVQMHAV